MRRLVGGGASLLALASALACSHDTLDRVTQYPDPPQLLSPIDGLCIADTATPRFEWTGVKSATDYLLEVAATPAFVDPICSLPNLAQPTAACATPFEPGRYYWRIHARSSEWEELKTEPLSFVITAGLANATLVPVSSPVCAAEVSLAWSDPSAGNDAVSYHAQLSTSESFATPLIDTNGITGSSISVSPPPLPSGTYYFRLQKLFYACPVGDWQWQSFTRAEPRPPPTHLSAQWTGCSTFDVLLTWEGSAARYEVSVTSDQGFVSTFYVNGNSLSFQAPIPAVYSWSVRDALGSCAGDWAIGDDLHLAAGRDWSSIAPASARFSPREGHGTAVSNDGSTLWVFAGEVGGDSNDVWSTTNGTHWTLLTPAADFSKRRWFGNAYFHDRLWLVGGNVGASSLNYADVWSSADGVAWTRETDMAFAARHSPTVVVFGDRLWLIAGEGPENCTSRSDVWSSADGAVWLRETADGGFPGRDWHASVVFNERLWVIGGINRDAGCASEYLDDVWSSADGRTWELTADGAFASRAGHSAVVFDGKIWVIGGTHAWPTASQSDVWYSSDGVTWCQATGTTEFSNRYGHTGAVFQDQLWVIAGFDQVSPPAGFQNDLWVSR